MTAFGPRASIEIEYQCVWADALVETCIARNKCARLVFIDCRGCPGEMDPSC